jgi:hypothetical protein
MSRRIRSSGMAGLAGALMIAGAFAAQAAPVGGGGTSTDMEGLRKQGYVCERTATNMITCTKKGAPTYTCDYAGQCAVLKVTLPKPSVIAPTQGPVALSTRV